MTNAVYQTRTFHDLETAYTPLWISSFRPMAIYLYK